MDCISYACFNGCTQTFSARARAHSHNVQCERRTMTYGRYDAKFDEFAFRSKFAKGFPVQPSHSIAQHYNTE